MLKFSKLKRNVIMDGFVVFCILFAIAILIYNIKYRPKSRNNYYKHNYHFNDFINDPKYHRHINNVHHFHRTDDTWR